MLKYRLLTSALLLPILLLLIFFLPSALFSIFMSLILFLMMIEWCQLSGLGSFSLKLTLSILTLVLCLPIFWLSSALWLVIALLCWMWAFITLFIYINKKDKILPLGWHQRSVKLTIGIIFLMSYWKSAIILQTLETKPWWLLFAIGIVWSADSGAYTFGRLYGTGTPLLVPSVSPKKTWVGFWGGLASGMITAVLLIILLPLSTHSPLILLGISLVVIIFSMLGDLFESMLKRQMGLKDSGGLLPGHGGLLDRLDSTLAAFPLFLSLLILFNVINGR